VTPKPLAHSVLPPKGALNKSILDFSAPAIGKAWFSDGSQNQWLAATDLGSASLRCGKRF
jgi:hypothetical protein